MKEFTKRLLDLIYQDVRPAIGCTEPVALAYAGSVCRKYVTGDINKIVLTTSKNIYKNGKSVMVPHTNGKSGLKLAFCLGLLNGDDTKNLMVLSDIDEDKLNNTLNFLNEVNIIQEIEYNCHSVYIKSEVLTDNENIEVIISAGHTNIVLIKVDDKVLLEKNVCDTSSSIDEDLIKTLDFDILVEITKDVDITELEYIKEGIKLNMEVFNEAIDSNYALNIGKTLKSLQDKNIIGTDVVTTIRIATSAAADMRMGGVSFRL